MIKEMTFWITLAFFVMIVFPALLLLCVIISPATGRDEAERVFSSVFDYWSDKITALSEESLRDAWR
jgi:hypothetical protein